MKSVKRKKVSCIILLSILLIPQLFGQVEANVKDFGAKGNGKTNDRDAIDRAIDYVNSKGGGTVIVEGGTFLSTTIHFKSNVTLLIKRNAQIKAAKFGFDIPTNTKGHTFDNSCKGTGNTLQDFGHTSYKNALFYGRGLKNIGIKGEGKFDWKTGKSPDGSKKLHVECKGLVSGNCHKKGEGDKGICFVESENIRIENLVWDGGGHFVLWIKDCDNVIIRNGWFDGERDGFNIGDCRDVLVEYCYVQGFDDALCLKSGYSNKKLLSCERNVFQHCIAISDCFALKFGATESFGGFNDIRYSDIDIYESGKGAIGFMCFNGADAKNVLFEDIRIHSKVNVPVVFEQGSSSKHPDPKRKGVPGTFENITLRNITGKNFDNKAWPLIINGNSRKKIVNLTIENMTIKLSGGGSKNNNHNPSRASWSGNGRNYPSAGLYVRNAKRMNLRNLNFDFDHHDSRDIVVIENSVDTIIGKITKKNASSNTMVQLWNSSGSKVCSDATGMGISGSVSTVACPAEFPIVTPEPPRFMTGPTSTPVPSKSLGDVNGDGNISIVDALTIAQFVVGLNPSNFDESVADVNCDGSISIIDALLIAQYYVNILDKFC